MRLSLILEMAVLTATPAVAQDVTYSLETAYTMKVKAADLQPIYSGKVGYIDQKQRPWRLVTPEKWAREVEADMRQATWNLTARADYDGDGKIDTANLYTNGKQLAVMVKFGKVRPAMIIYKTDWINPGTEIMGRGKRFVVSVPEIGYKILLMAKGKPAMTYMGD